ncbi:MAG: hypothetical protein ABF297_13145 [Thiogranum sp.]
MWVKFYGRDRFVGPLLSLCVWLIPTVASAAPTDLVGSGAWTALLAGDKYDPNSDTQAAKAGTEVVGDAAHPSFYINYDDNGTTGGVAPEADDILSFRLRIGDETKSTHSAYAFFGIEASGDGTLEPTPIYRPIPPTWRMHPTGPTRKPRQTTILPWYRLPMTPTGMATMILMETATPTYS